MIISHETLDLVLRLLVAAALGGALGIERDIHGRGAGLRTHLLVSTGAAVFMILSTHVASFGVISTDEFTKVTDPGRIAAQIVTGIGFIGAGVIIKEGFTIRGLTTAACLWVAASIGMASGAGKFFLAMVTTSLALFSLIFLRYFERLYPKDVYRHLILSFPNEIDIRTVIDTIKSKQVKIIFFGFDRDYETGMTTVTISLRLIYRGNADELSHIVVDKIERSRIPIKSARWIGPS